MKKLLFTTALISTLMIHDAEASAESSAPEQPYSRFSRMIDENDTPDRVFKNVMFFVNDLSNSPNNRIKLIQKMLAKEKWYEALRQNNKIYNLTTTLLEIFDQNKAGEITALTDIDTLALLESLSILSDPYNYISDLAEFLELQDIVLNDALITAKDVSLALAVRYQAANILVSSKDPQFHPACERVFADVLRIEGDVLSKREAAKYIVANSVIIELQDLALTILRSIYAEEAKKPP